jgi:hypothetical protein
VKNDDGRDVNVMLAQTCPETVDLYDHLQGEGRSALSLDAHLAGCAACRESLEGLKAALDVEAQAFAPPSELEVERALQTVRARGQARLRRPWRTTAMAFAAAAVTLAMLLPRAFVSPMDSGKPTGSGGGFGNVGAPPPTTVRAPEVFAVTSSFAPVCSDVVERAMLRESSNK